MRYKKGSKVEVFNKNEVPSGSWFCAEIICGNGHNYTVRYDRCPGVIDEAVMERVSRKSIRPCPPSVELSESWMPGDVVEVFHNFSWKMATVSKVLFKNHYLVRLVGSSQEFKVSKFDLRVRQSWQDDQWIVIGKGSGNSEGRKHNEVSLLKYNEHVGSQVNKIGAKSYILAKNSGFAAQNNSKFQESHIVSARTMKRSSPCGYSQIEAYEGDAQKYRGIEREGRRQRVVVAGPFQSPEKVDAVASTREKLSEKCINNLFDDRMTYFSEMYVERKETKGAIGCSLAISLQTNDADDACSVGSCSINSNNPYELHCHTGLVRETEDHLNDAESICHLRDEEGDCLFPNKEELAEEIHRLELHAYRCTMEALHASGPLSWERETLVTDLRISLHISNDEHLMEIKNLVSTASSIPIS